MAERPRMWGIDVVAALYAVLTGAMAILAAFGSGSDHTIGLVFAPFLAVFAVGIFFRSNIVRILLVSGLSLKMFHDGLYLFYALASLFGFDFMPANREPEYLPKLLLRFLLLTSMTIYLQRTEVLNAFRRRRKRRKKSVVVDEFDL